MKKSSKFIPAIMAFATACGGPLESDNAKKGELVSSMGGSSGSDDESDEDEKEQLIGDMERLSLDGGTDADAGAIPDELDTGGFTIKTEDGGVFGSGFLRGDQFYVAVNNGIRVFDVGDGGVEGDAGPGALDDAGVFTIPAEDGGVAGSGYFRDNRLYVAVNNVLHILDLADSGTGTPSREDAGVFTIRGEDGGDSCSGYMNDGRLYVAANDGIHVYDMPNVDAGSSGYIENGHVHVVANDGVVYAFNLADGGTTEDAAASAAPSSSSAR